MDPVKERSWPYNGKLRKAMDTKSSTTLFGLLSYICRSENSGGNISYKPQLDGNTGKHGDHQTHFHVYGIESPKIGKRMIIKTL